MRKFNGAAMNESETSPASDAETVKDTPAPKIPGAWINYGEKSTIGIYVHPDEGVCIGHFANTDSADPCDSAFSVLPDGTIKVQSIDGKGDLRSRSISPSRAVTLLRQFFRSVQDIAELE